MVNKIKVSKFSTDPQIEKILGPIPNYEKQSCSNTKTNFKDIENCKEVNKDG